MPLHLCIFNATLLLVRIGMCHRYARVLLEIISKINHINQQQIDASSLKPATAINPTTFPFSSSYAPQALQQPTPSVTKAEPERAKDQDLH